VGKSRSTLTWGQSLPSEDEHPADHCTDATREVRREDGELVGLLLWVEGAAFETVADHARFCGNDGTYTHTQGMFLGSWQFIAAGFAATAMANSVKKHRAEARSVPRWRDVLRTRVIATDQRLLIEIPNRGLQYFWCAGMQELYPAPREWGVVMVWPDAAPLRKTGLSAPDLAVHIAAHVMPGQWTHHPRRQELVGGPVDRV